VLVEDDQVVQAFSTERPDDAFDDGVHVRRQLPAVTGVRSGFASRTRSTH
jgi:hypothetical protein